MLRAYVPANLGLLLTYMPTCLFFTCLDVCEFNLPMYVYSIKCLYLIRSFNTELWPNLKPWFQLNFNEILKVKKLGLVINLFFSLPKFSLPYGTKVGWCWVKVGEPLHQDEWTIDQVMLWQSKNSKFALPRYLWRPNWTGW